MLFLQYTYMNTLTIVIPS